MKDILIGAADLYTWKDIAPWARSVRQHGFQGDIYLITYRVNLDVENALKYGVEFYHVEHTPYSTPINHSSQGTPTQSHNLRFYHAWELLTRLLEESRYRYVIMTDVRDVIFQQNPISWLLSNIPVNHCGDPVECALVAPSEGIKYADEDWNKANLINGFGSILYELEADAWQAFNVGTIAGTAVAMKDLFQTIFRMTEGRYYPSDQSSFNVILRSAFAGNWIYGSHEIGWAAQCGTTLDPTKSYLWDRCNEERPIIGTDGVVKTKSGMPFVIVHQWDRVPELKARILERYL